MHVGQPLTPTTPPPATQVRRSRGGIVQQNVSLKTFFHRRGWVFPIFVKKCGIEVGQNSRWQSETTPTPHPRLSLVAPPSPILLPLSRFPPTTPPVSARSAVCRNAAPSLLASRRSTLKDLGLTAIFRPGPFRKQWEGTAVMAAAGQGSDQGADYRRGASNTKTR